MPVSGKTSPDEIPFLLDGDIPDMGAGDKAIAERVQAILKEEGRQPLSWLKKGTKKQIIVCNSSGVPQYVTLGGDATIDEEGTFQLGKKVVGTEELADNAVGPAKINENAVTAAAIAAGAVGASEIADGTITDTELAQPIRRGQISQGGGELAGSGFTSKRTATGKYEITLTKELPFKGLMIAIPAEEGGLGYRAVVETQGKKVFTVWIYEGATNLLTNGRFNFWVLPEG